MNSIRIQVVDKSSSNSYHVKLFVDEQESGIFYLREEQFLFLCKALQKECTSSDVEYECEDPFVDSDDDVDLD